MKTKYLIPFLLFGAVSCQTKEEPIEVIAPKAKNELNMEALKAFKATSEKRTQVIAMFAGWGQAPSYSSLSTLPDSLDVVVLTDNYSDLNEGRQADLKSVQEAKATKVLIRLDLQKEVASSAKMAKKAFKAEKKALQDKWGATTPADADAQVEELKKTVFAKYKTMLIKDFSAKQKANIALLSQYGYKGLSLKLPYNFEFLSADEVKPLLKAYTDVAGKKKTSMLIIENPKTELRELVEMANLLVMAKPDENLIATFDKEASEWENSAYCPSFDKLDQKLAKGFEDFKLFGANGSLPKDLYLAKWTAKNKKAIAIYNAEKYYAEIANVDGYVLPYSTLRQYINFVNAQ